MRLLDERLLPAAAALGFLLLILPSAASQNQELQVAGLEAENVNTSFRSDEICFNNSQVDKCLDPKKVFVPNILDDKLWSFTYSLQSFDEDQWPGVAAQLFLQIQYGNHWSMTYPTEELSTVLGNKDAGGDLTPHTFNYDNYDYVRTSNGTTEVFDMALEDGPTQFDINVKAHYEHLIIEYEVLQNVSRTVTKTVNGTNVTTTESVSKVVWETEDVYSDEEPELTPIDARADSNTIAENPSQSLTIDYDNKYDDRKNITFIAAVPENSSLLDFRTSAEKAVKADSSFYPEVRSRIIENNLSDRYLLNDSSRYRFQAYNLTVPEDSTISASVESSITGNRSQLYGYILGSTGATLTTAELEDSTITDYKRYKGLNVTSASGTPTIDKAQPVYWSCGDDSTTGTGDIIIDCSAVDGVEDLAFYDTNGDLLNYEIESFSSSSGGVVWVYNSWTRDGDIGAYVAYGDGPSDRQDVTGTWSNTGAAIVQHLQDDPLTATDSTGNNNDGTVNGATATTGQFDGAASFGGSSEWIDVPDHDSLSDASSDAELTFTAAINLDDLSKYGIFFGKFDTSSNAEREYAFGHTSDGGIRLLANEAGYTSTGVDYRTSNDMSAGTNYLIGGVIDVGSDTYRAFVDGNEVAGSNTGSDISDMENTGSPLTFGKLTNRDIQYIDGMLDAARLYFDDKSQIPGWMQADFDASAKAGKVFFDQNSGQSTVTNQRPKVDIPVVRPSSPVSPGSEVNVSVNVTDPDNNLESVNISLLDPDGGVEVSNASVTNNTEEASEYFYSFTVPDGASSLGTWNATVYAEDTAEASNSSSTAFNVTDQSSPNWFNLQTNASGGEIFNTEVLNISSSWRDNESGVYKAVLATNETGTWKNWTDRYGSPEFFNNTTLEKVLSDFTWSNQSFNGSLSYRVYARDKAGNWNNTETREIRVNGVITEELTDSTNITGSTSSYGDFFGEASTSFDLTGAIETVVSKSVFLQSVVNATASKVEEVEVSEVISSPVTLSMELVSFTSAEDRKDTNVDIDDSTQGRGEVSDSASATFKPGAEVEVLGVNASTALDTVVDLNSSSESQGLVTDSVSTTVTALTQVFSETAVNSSVTTIVDVLGNTDSQASANDTASTNIQVNGIASSTATTSLELFTPLTVTTTTTEQGTATSQVSTDLGFSTDLASQVTGTGIVSTVIDVTEICWAGAPCYQDITGNQTEQPSEGTGIIEGEGPLTIIKPVPIPAKSVPEWMQIYYQQHRNKIHGFALFLIVATGFLTLRKVVQFIL